MTNKADPKTTPKDADKTDPHPGMMATAPKSKISVSPAIPPPASKRMRWTKPSARSRNSLKYYVIPTTDKFAYKGRAALRPAFI
jgi:hypothetical protein